LNRIDLICTGWRRVIAALAGCVLAFGKGGSISMALIPAVAYLRMSTDKQEESIARQRAEVTAYAKRKGYAIQREYVDPGISGDEIEKRPAFRQMLHDAPRREFEMIVCWDQSRFGRFDQITMGYVVFQFRQAGVSLDRVVEGLADWHTQPGQLVENANQMGKHQFCKDLSRNTASGILRKLSKREHPGLPPFGYRKEGTRLVPDANAPVVREIFRRYALLGHSIRSITLDLNRRGVPTARKTTKWARATIQKMLLCRTYLGIITWNATSKSKYHVIHPGAAPEDKRPGDPANRINSEEDWVVIEGPHEALIDERTFELARERLQAARRDRTPADGTTYVFTGKILCGNCGSRMISRNNKHRKIWQIVYVCSGGNVAGPTKCRCRTIAEDDLLHTVAQFLDQHVFGGFDPEAWRVRIKRLLRERARGSPKETARLRKSVAGLAAKIETGTERYMTAPTSMTGDIAKKLEAWRRERKELAARLAEMEQTTVSDAEISRLADDSVGFLASMSLTLANADAAKLHELYQRILGEIRVTFRDERVGKIFRSRPARWQIKLNPCHHWPNRRGEDYLSWFLLDLCNPMLTGKLLELAAINKREPSFSGELQCVAGKAATCYKIAPCHACIGMHHTPKLLQHRPTHIALLMLALNYDPISPGCTDSLGTNIDASVVASARHFDLIALLLVEHPDEVFELFVVHIV
jgi:DNA invertase Pin-like site-specific DNA recombinase